MPAVNSLSTMSTLAERFSQLRAAGEKALVPYVTAGDPELSQLPGILAALQSGGADVIEIGIPFSDPIADGPTIQGSSQRALDRGVTVAAILGSVKSAKLSVPIVFMGYTNTALRLGFDGFARKAKEAGASGVILSDLTPEESGDWKHAAAEVGLDTIFLVAPTSTEDRIRIACEASSGFVYCVSRTGVTGAADRVPDEVRETVRRIRSFTDLPICVGFGISRPDDVRMVCEVADGAVVGSYLVDLLAREWNDGKGESKVVEFISSLKKAT